VPFEWDRLFARTPSWALPARVEPAPTPGAGLSEKELPTVIILGVILIILGFVIGIPVLYTIGIVLAVAGVVLALLGGTGRKIGGRAHWF
jgi:hypothetical protein